MGEVLASAPCQVQDTQWHGRAINTQEGERRLSPEKRTHLGSVRHKFSLPLASLRCQTLHKGCAVC